MAEQKLNLANVGARFKQVTCKGMPHGMRRDGFTEFRKYGGLSDTSPQPKSWLCVGPGSPRKEPVSRPFHSPPGSQDL